MWADCDALHLDHATSTFSMPYQCLGCLQTKRFLGFEVEETEDSYFQEENTTKGKDNRETANFK